MSWLRLAAERDEPTAQFLLATAYWEGDGVERNQVLAFSWMKKALENGDEDAEEELCEWRRQTAAGEGAEAHDSTQDEQADDDEEEEPGAFTDALLLQAEQGDAEAQHELGLCYQHGDGTPVDLDLAASWFRRSAEQDHPAGQHSLGVIMWSGSGVPKDREAAMVWMRKAAEQGLENAQFSLGWRAEKGELTQDFEEARHWYRLAAEQGNPRAQWRLGVLLRQGAGGEAQASEALQWFRRAAEQGDADAQYSLGAALWDGKDTEQDRQEAERWLVEAAEQDLRRALSWLGTRPKGELLAAPERVEDWLLRAVELGDIDAAVHLATRPGSSWQDYRLALDTVKAAARLGDPDARFWENRLRLKRHRVALRWSLRALYALGIGVLAAHLTESEAIFEGSGVAWTLAAFLGGGALAGGLLYFLAPTASIEEARAEIDSVDRAVGGPSVSHLRSLWQVPAQDGLLLVPVVWSDGAFWAAALAGGAFAALRYPFTSTRIALLHGVAYAMIAAWLLPWLGLLSVIAARVLWAVLLNLSNVWVMRRFSAES